MSQKNSDYKLARPNLHDMLPVVNQDPLLKALTETTYNRFYTKPELQRVIGTIGSRKSSVVDNQIVEATAFDQAYQLQPAIINRSTSETQISTYKDIKRICEQLGIDVDRVEDWQNTEQFNYALPINLDKMVNYSEYYWTGLSEPEYVVIENPRLRLQAQLSQMVSFYPASADQAGTWANIVGLMDTIHANIPAQERLPILNLELILNDPSHPPYVPSVVEASPEYTIKSDWAAQNKWVHRLDVYDLSSVVQAKMPIIEYNENVQLTEYTYTGQLWKYRRSAGYPWTFNTNGPSHAELFNRIPIIAASRDNDTFAVAGDQRAHIVQNEYFIIEDATVYAGKWLAKNVEYDANTNSTVVKVDGNITIDVAMGYIRPFAVTSLGDDWKGLQTHWMLVEVQTPKPSTPPSAAELAEDQNKDSVVNVRVSEDDEVPYATVNLTKFRKLAQRKTIRNQYPLFDIVDIHGESLRESASIITFKEDSTVDVDPVFGARIIRDVLTKDYTFDISLVQSNGALRFYVNTDLGKPAAIWSTGAPYAPQKVDKDRQPTDDEMVETIYEIPNQFSNNVHHECRNVLKYSELFLHMKSMLDNQPPADEVIYGTNLNRANSYRLQETVDYSLGGTIKEYNYSFDNFVSSLISSHYTLPSMLTFAENQYSEMLVSVREMVERNMFNALTSDDPHALGDLVSYLENKVLEQIRNDTNLSRIYGDSSVTTQSSVSNWIATLPYLRLSKTAQVVKLYDPKRNIVELVHHDGHSGAEEANPTTAGTVKADLISKLGLFPNGIQDNKPAVPNAGQLWYNAAEKNLYRLDVAAVGQTIPNALSYPEGSYFYNTVTTGLYVQRNGTWILTIDTLDTRWKLFDVMDIVLEVLCSIETRLSGAVPERTLWTDRLPVPNENLMRDLIKLEFEAYAKVNNITDLYQGDFDQTNAFTWNYTSAFGFACWQDVYEQALGTAYPHLEPWKLQGFDVKPSWWDLEYDGRSEQRRWKAKMWANILSGIIPPGRSAPSDNLIVPPKVCVNITTRTTADGYGPDDILPPYWVPAIPNDNIIGIANQALIDIKPSTVDISTNTFTFGMNGPKERAWKKSLNYKYALLRSMFRIDPVRFMHYTFGEEFESINGLEVNARTSSVLSHRNVVFHGDADANGETQLFDGVNQLYVNFFRYNALDLNGSEFKRAWTSWTTQLSYSVGSFVIDNTLSIDSSLFELTSNDYTVEVKKAYHVNDVWVDALYVSIAQAGSPREMMYGAARDWKFNVSTHCPVIREAKYYGAKKLMVTADADNNTITLTNGTLADMSWQAGDAIVMDIGANGVLPKALDDMSYYFIIPVNDVSFMVADSKEAALENTSLSLGSSGEGTVYVAELDRTFYALEGRHTPILWKHFAINKNDIRTFTSSVPITGIQNVVDFVNGYSSYLADQGIVFNDPSVQEYDGATNRQINWQYTIENLIDSVFLVGLSGSRSSAAFQLGEIELNPFRRNVWIKHPKGVVSQFNSLDVKDSNSMAIAYDVQGNRIDGRKYHVLREDSMTQLMTIGQPIEGTQSTGNTLPMEEVAFGGFHVYFDEYEHTVMFNPYTISNSLVYDSFLGIAASRFNVYFEKQAESTKRPNIGGFVYKDGKFIQNYEYTASNILNYYDTFTVNENSDFVNYARRLLGYTPNESYMVDNNVTPKSQFLFYKGMIKAKGTAGSIKAFTGSKHFTSARVDEFWAYRAFDFGDSRQDVSYTMSLIPEDTVRSHAKFEFVDQTSDASEEYFTSIPLADTSRWPDFPSQSQALTGSYGIFGAKVISENSVTPTTVLNGGVSRQVIFHKSCDGIILRQNVSLTRQRVTSIANGPSDVILPNNRTYLPGTGAIKVYVNGAVQAVGVDYLELDSSTVRLIGDVPNNAVVVIIPEIATLQENVHYARLSNDSIHVFDPSLTGLVLVRCNVDYDSVSPVHIYDSIAKAVVTDVPAWDPLADIHQAKLMQYVDLFASRDPAYDYYNNVVRESLYGETNFWNAPEIGKVWLDTNSFGYLDYKNVNLTTNERLVKWGKMEEWSDPAVYRWVESAVPPQDYTLGTPRTEVYSRKRTVYSVIVSTGYMTLIGNHSFVAGDEIALNSTGDLPLMLRPDTVYTIGSVSGNVITICDRTGEIVPFANDGNGDVTLSAASFSGQWSLVPQTVEAYRAYDIDRNTMTLKTMLPEGTEFSLFVNGTFVQDGPVLSNGVIVVEPETMDVFAKTIDGTKLTVLRKTGIVDGLQNTKPDDMDLSPASEQMYVGYPHSKVQYVDDSGVLHQPLYYFWVRGSDDLIADGVAMTTTGLEHLVYQNDEAYMLIQHAAVIDKEVRFNQLVLCGVHGVVSEPNRYALRMRKNYTLRHRIQNPNGSLLKTSHSEWIMFREKQNQHVDKSLWNMVIEAVVGHSIKDASVPVPSLERVVYDNINGTNTRYGIGEGQAFVDGSMAFETILMELNSSETDFSPIDIDYFLETHETVTPEGLLQFMNDIYSSFSAEHVNKLFFAVMMDALANINVDYTASLMKTSAISINGVTPLNVNGEFDE